MSREDELHLEIQKWSLSLTERFDDIGFMDFVVSLYAGQRAKVVPMLATTALGEESRMIEKYLSRRKNWITHVSVVRERGVLRYSFEADGASSPVVYRESGEWWMRSNAAH